MQNLFIYQYIRGVIAMLDFWKNFEDTGSVENYLTYKSNESEDSTDDYDDEDGTYE